ncbi:MAG: hypothetical protein AAGF20_05380 [Pseudomonadota bacterium]
MIRYTLPALALGLSSLSMGPMASALTPQEARACNTMGASLQVRQKKAQNEKIALEALAINVEDAGDAWEGDEAMRAFSTAAAQKADASKQAYDTLVAELDRRQRALQSEVVSINSGVMSYNRRCVTGE